MGFYTMSIRLATLSKKMTILFTLSTNKKATEICIRYNDINRAIKQAKYQKSYIRPVGLRTI